MSVPFFPPNGSRLLIDSSIALKANSRFLNRYRVPRSFKLILASLLVFLLVSIKAAKRSVRIRFDYSFDELVTRESDANDNSESSALDVSYKSNS